MMSWTITLREATGVVRVFELGAGMVQVGSDESAEVCVCDSGVAPFQLRLHLGAGRLEVERLADSLMVHVNGSVLGERMEAASPCQIELGGAVVEVACGVLESTDVTRVIRRAEGVVQEPASGDAPQDAERTLRIQMPERSGKTEAQGLVVEVLEGAEREALTRAASPSGKDAGVEMAGLKTDRETFETGSSALAQAGYRLDAEIARGGMGRIFEAHDPLLRRRVAVKVSAVSRAGADDQFRMEAEVLARLAHPNIVPVHAFGRTETGRPFYAMKLVAGKTLKTILRELAVREPAALAHYTRERLLNVLCKVCDAVAFAHAEGFLHRDLKPENVMVGEFGEVLVMDWGLARRLPGRGELGGIPEAGVATRYIEGTPQYMAPEQAAGHALDERSDLYALGGILYSILTLRPPVEGRSVQEVLEKVKRCELSAITTKRVAPTKKGEPVLEEGRVPEALRAITLKAMACERRNRYARVQDLVADIEAYQNGFATSAEQAGLGRQLMLLLRRHRAVSALVGVLLVSALLFTVRLARSERLARFHATEALENARKASRSAEEARESARVAQANERRAEEEKQMARRSAAEAQIALAEAAESDANGEEMLRVLAMVPPDLRGQEWTYLNKRAESSDLTIEAKGGSPWMAWAAHPQKPGALVTLQADGWIRTVQLATGEQNDLCNISRPGGMFENSLSVSGNGARVAVVFKKEMPNGAGFSLSIEVYDLGTGRPVWKGTVVRDKAYCAVMLNQDGSLLLNSCLATISTLEMNEIPSGKQLWVRSTNGLYARFAATFVDSATVQVYSVKDGMVRLAARTGAELAPPTPLPLLRGPFNDWQWEVSNRGNFLAFAQHDVCNFSVDSGAHMHSVRLTDPYCRIASTDQGKTLAVLSAKSDQSRVLQLWSTASASLKRTIPVSMTSSGGSGRTEWALVTQPASGHLAVIRGARMRVWHPQDGSQTPEKARWEAPVGFLGRSSRLLSWPLTKPLDQNRSQHWMRITDVRAAPGVPGGSVLAVGDPLMEQVCLSKNGERLLLQTWSSNGLPTMQVFKRTAEEGFERIFSGVMAQRPWPLQAALNPQGSLLWTGHGLLNAENGEVFRTMNRRLVQAPQLAKCPPVWLDDATVLEVAFFDQEAAVKQYGFRGRALAIWKIDQTEPVVVVSAPDASSLAVSPDGSKIAEGGRDMRVRIRDARTLQVERSLRVHDATVTGVEWHPTQPLLATCSEDYSVKIWDLRSESLVERYGFHDKPMEKVLWSPDGLELCAALNRGSSWVYRPGALQPSGGAAVPPPPAVVPGGK